MLVPPHSTHGKEDDPPNTSLSLGNFNVAPQLDPHEETQMSNCSEHPILSIDQTAARLKISRSKAYEWARANVFPTFSVGQRVLVKCEELSRWLAGTLVADASIHSE